MVFRFKLGVRALKRRGPGCRYRDYYGVPEGAINVPIGRVRVPEEDKWEYVLDRIVLALDAHRACAPRGVRIMGEIRAWFWLEDSSHT
jgi:hypothetical protein